MNVTIISTTKSEMKIGIKYFSDCSNRMRAMFDAMNIFKPSGGVIKPNAKFRQTMIPK